MPKDLFVEKPKNFSFYHTVNSHGWYDLPPFLLDRDTGTLSYIFGIRGKTFPVRISDAGTSIKVELGVKTSARDEGALLASVKHMLRLDDDLGFFYATVARIESMKWVSESGAGRLLRSPTVWEDLVKTLCTTNCSWGLTRNMVGNLTSKLGVAGRGGVYAFPDAQALASVGEDFYRNEIKAGYRSPYFVELAVSVAEGKLDPERWLQFEGSTEDLKKQLKLIKGIGDYAAENMLKLLGRYDGLALDSWLRAQFYKKHQRGKTCSDKKITRHYSRYGEWQGLAIWCDMTENWFHRQPVPGSDES
jgi:3-methyladenine DNA glycosylase/8-oxoguanine DNA glycosylase